MSKRIQIRFHAIVPVMLFCAVAVLAQETANCRGPIYDAKDVKVPAKISGLLQFQTAPKNWTPGVEAHVVVEAILCRTGVVTEYKVIKSDPPNAANFAIAALSNMTFKPAEANWHTVSQRQRFEMTFNERGVSGVHLAGTPEGLTVTAPRRLTEVVDVVGNRRLDKNLILSWIQTRPGEPYDPDQVKRDLETVLKTGWFDKTSTRVSMEDAPRDGIRVIFEVKELPLIARLSFDDHAGALNQSAILNEFARQHIDLAIGRPFDPVNLKKACQAIEKYFGSQGWVNVKADATVENLSPTEIKITFKITGTNF